MGHVLRLDTRLPGTGGLRWTNWSDNTLRLDARASNTQSHLSTDVWPTQTNQAYSASLRRCKHETNLESVSNRRLRIHRSPKRIRHKAEGVTWPIIALTAIFSNHSPTEHTTAASEEDQYTNPKKGNVTIGRRYNNMALKCDNCPFGDVDCSNGPFDECYE